MTNSGALDGTTHYVHDRSGNVIAELNAAGATVREYIWLPEAEIAPTAASRATIDRPIAVVDGVNAAPATYYVHTDHLHRPIRMSNAAKSIVWSAEYQPWGAVQSLSGALTLDLRFPGQWFQLEAGLHYNWHRHYDASLGRYTQPDPLGFVDGPSVYGYAGGSPYRYVDPSGRFFPALPFILGGLGGAAGAFIIDLSINWWKEKDLWQAFCKIDALNVIFGSIAGVAAPGNLALVLREIRALIAGAGSGASITAIKTFTTQGMIKFSVDFKIPEAPMSSFFEKCRCQR